MKTGTTGHGGIGRRAVDRMKVACAAMLLVVPGCADVDISGPDWAWDGDFGQAWDTTYAAQADFRFRVGSLGALSLTGLAGSVKIVGRVDATAIVVAGIRRVRSYSEADARAHLSELAVEVSESDGTVFVETAQPRMGRGRSYQVEYRIEVPVPTAVTLRQVAGPVDVAAVGGNVDADLTAGSLSLRDLTGNVRAAVVAGSVDATLSLGAGGTVDLRSTAGDIGLSIPTGTSAHLRAVAAAGLVRALGLALVDEDPRASVLQATMADGAGSIRLETGVGDITVKGR